jgi:hypothetical protein
MSERGPNRFPLIGMTMAICLPIVVIGAIAYLLDRRPVTDAQAEVPLSHADGCLLADRLLKERVFEERPDCHDVLGDRSAVAQNVH